MKIFGLSISDAVLVVDLYGGESNACGHVSFTFPSYAALQRAHDKLKGWETSGVEVELDDSSPSSMTLRPVREKC